MVLSLFSMLGLGNELNTSATIGNPDASAYYYDVNGVPKCWAVNLTSPFGEEGHVNRVATVASALAYASWHNATSEYTLFYDQSGSSAKIVQYANVGNVDASTGGINLPFTVEGSMGFIAMIIALMIFAGVVSLRIVSSGMSEEGVSTIIKGTALVIMWTILSFLAYPLILATNFFLLYMVYFVLTGIYALGCINSFGHPGED